MRLHHLCSTLLAASALLAHPGPRDALAFCRTHTVAPTIAGNCATGGVPLEWPCAGVTFACNERGTDMFSMDTVHQVADTAAATWAAGDCGSGATPSFLMTRVGDTDVGTGFTRGGHNVNTVSFLTEWPDDVNHQPGSIAITLVSFDTTTGEILDADTELNQQSPQNPDGFVFSIGAPTANQVDLPTVLLHEFGHFQGLAHSSVSTAVMWPTAGFGEQRRVLTDDDLGGICEAYPPGRTAPMTCASQQHGGCGCGVPGRADVGGGVGLLAAGAALVLARRRRRA